MSRREIIPRLDLVQRPRRNRKADWSRRLVRETDISVNDLIWPIFVQTGHGRFEPREVQLVKRSETMMVLAGGVEPGEIIAMSDPTADQSDKKKNDRKSNSGAMEAMPAGGK